MKNWMYGALIAIFAVVIVLGTLSGEPSAEDRAAAIGSRIMCPVCQGSAIANSPSETAVSMMDKVEELVDAGRTDDEILQYFSDRYGDNIILDPRFEGKTLLVWLLPVAAFGVGVWMIIRRRRKAPEHVGSER